MSSAFGAWAPPSAAALDAMLVEDGAAHEREGGRPIRHAERERWRRIIEQIHGPMRAAKMDPFIGHDPCALCGVRGPLVPIWKRYPFALVGLLGPEARRRAAETYVCADECGEEDHPMLELKITTREVHLKVAAARIPAGRYRARSESTTPRNVVVERLVGDAWTFVGVALVRDTRPFILGNGILSGELFPAELLQALADGLTTAVRA